MILKLRYETKGAHIHVEVFVGPHDEALGLAGTLTLRPAEWEVFRAIIDAGEVEVENVIVRYGLRFVEGKGVADGK